MIGDIHGVAAGIHGQAHRLDEGGIPGSRVQLSDPGANFITAPDAMVYRLPAVSTAPTVSSKSSHLQAAAAGQSYSGAHGLCSGVLTTPKQGRIFIL